MARKILVVTNDRHTVFSIRSCLGWDDYQIFVAYSGTEALEKVRAERPDLVIIDKQVLERARRFLKDLQTAIVTDKTSVILITDADDTGFVDGWKINVNGLVLRPLDPRKLAVKINRIVGKR